MRDVAALAGVGLKTVSRVVNDEPRVSSATRELVGTLCERRVDGLIVVPAATDHSYLLSELRSGTALVFADRPARFLDADSVTWDDVGGARRAVAHLGSFGHRRIAYLGDDVGI